jgi:AcrR family transcriptional regulator
MADHSLRSRFKETVSEAILDAAEELAAEVGIQNAGLQQIAQKAGVAVGTIYNHFSDRNELFEELFKRLRRHVVTSLDRAMEGVAKKPFAKQLDTFVRTVLSLYDDRRNALRVAFDADALRIRAEAGERPSKAYEALRTRAERLVKLGIKEKRLRSEGSELFPLFLVSALRTLLLTRLDENAPFATETETVVMLFLHGAAR